MKPEYITHKREPFFEIARDLINKEHNVLDVGSGNGSFAKYCNMLNMHLFEGNKESAQAIFKNVVYGRLPKLPFKDNFFDVIHMSHVIEHLEPDEVYQTLIEFDRCLKNNGIIIISAPLIWSGFYDDLSHVKPYPPAIFIKYLCVGDHQNLSRNKISNKFKVERQEFRYLKSKRSISRPKSNSFFNRLFFKILNALYNKTLTFYEKTGYTIVLRKNR